jgi:hypothetical protein
MEKDLTLGFHSWLPLGFHLLDPWLPLAWLPVGFHVTKDLTLGFHVEPARLRLQF